MIQNESMVLLNLYLMIFQLIHKRISIFVNRLNRVRLDTTLSPVLFEFHSLCALKQTRNSYESMVWVGLSEPTPKGLMERYLWSVSLPVAFHSLGFKIITCLHLAEPYDWVSIVKYLPASGRCQFPLQLENTFVNFTCMNLGE